MTYDNKSKSTSDDIYIEGEASTPDILERLEAVKKLKELLEIGAITKEEFEKKKKELLRLQVKRNLFVILIWASLGFTIFSYFINVIISLKVGGDLFWMFDYILYGYIAGFICMVIGIIGYAVSFCRLTKKKESAKTRIVSLILMIALLCVTFSPLVLHDPCKYTAITKWTGLVNTSYIVTGCEYRRTNVKIASEHKDLPVTGIGDYAFSGHHKLEKVELPDSITSIGAFAFYGSENLTTLVIPDSVTSINHNAFVGCNSLIIYCEYEQKPESWSSYWNCLVYYDDIPLTQNLRYVKVYWAGEWEYDWRGNPVLIE